MHALAQKILTVEDDPIVRADVRSILEDAGFDACPDARDGVQAVELAVAHKPDLVLLDLGLPGLDGVEATRRILDEVDDVAIVALTGSRRGAERAVDAGATDYVLKPFSATQLVATLRRVLGVRAARRRAAEEAEDLSLRIMVERMVRADCSAEEIEREVRARRAD